MYDTRCCGSGACIINAEGLCWCGQKWDGAKMLKPQTDEKDENTFTGVKESLKTDDNLPK